jgi:chromosomal replication initiator protein
MNTMSPTITQSPEIPGIRDILRECREKIELLIGEKVTVSYRIRIHQISTSDLARIVCAVCGVTWEQLTSSSRYSHLVIARQLYCYFSRTVQRIPLAKIGQILGGRDHTTVIHNLDRVEAMMFTKDELYMPLIAEIEEEINKTLSAI